MIHARLTAYVILCLACFSLSHAAPAVEPWTWTETFESGAVGPWASYPPSQDTAYDPSIRVLPLAVESADNRALWREIVPNYSIDHEFGARKLLDLWVNDTSVVTFRAFVKSYRGVRGVRVRLGFADGSSAERLISFEAAETWTPCRLDLAGIIPPGRLTKLNAAAFMAVCPNADPETLIRFGLDDVSITGFRERPFAFEEPAVHTLAEWGDRIAAHHFDSSGSLTISGKAPVDASGATVTVSRALTGEDARVIPMQRRGDRLSCAVPLDRAKGGIGPGFWRAVVSGSDRRASFSSSMVFLVKRPDVPTGHPSLYYSPADVAAIMKRAESGHQKTVWEAIRSRALRSREREKVDNFGYAFDVFNVEHWLPVFGDFGSRLRTPQDYIRDNALVYALSGDKEAGEAAHQALVKVAGWPAYVPDHITNQGKHSYYITGIFLTDLALGYDLVHDLLTPEERKTVADALLNRGAREAYKEYVEDNWVSSHTSNWIGDVTAGGILCLLAVAGDYGPEELEPYLSGSILKAGALVNGAFDRGGAYGEGSLYYMHALHGLTKSMAVLERFYGVRFPEYVSRSHRFFLYTLDPETKRLYTFGDAFENLMGFAPDSYLGMGNAAWLVAKYRDPHLKWLYDMNPGTTERDLFFPVETVEAKPPDDLPKTAHFADEGTTVFRSGFSHGDFMLVFRCGPYVNHQHFDQGGFFLADLGDEFVGEVGRTDYYADLAYQNLVIQPGGHSTILADGNPESQRHGDFLRDVPAWRTFAQTTDYVPFDGGAFVSGRLDPLYFGKLTNLRRSILYMAPRTALIIDEATPAPGTKEIDLRFHAPFMDDITVSGRDARIARPAGTLTIRTITPENRRADILRRPMTLREINDRSPENMKKRGFLQLTAQFDSAGTPLTVVNALGTDSETLRRMDERRYPSHLALTFGGERCLVSTSSGGRYTDGAVETDALVYSAIPSGWIALRTRYVARARHVVVTANRPVSLAFTDGAVRRLAYSTARGATLTLDLSWRPGKVIMNGAPSSDWRYSPGEGIVLNLPAGNGTVEMR